MKKTWKSRAVSGLLTAVFTAGLLPMSVFAAGCAHESVVQGKCSEASCDKVIVAQVGTKGFEVLADAVTYANGEAVTEKAIVLWEDVSGADFAEKKLNLGAAYLEVQPFYLEATPTTMETVKISDTIISGTHAKQLLVNHGSLILDEVTLTTTGSYGVYTAGAAKSREDTTVVPAMLQVIGGSYTGGDYALGVKDATLRLNRASTPGEGEDAQPVLGNAIALQGDKAALQLDTGSVVEVMADLGDDTAYTVEALQPGAVIHMGGGPTVPATPKETWFKSTSGEAGFKEGVWTVPVSLAAAELTLTPESYTYNGKTQMPAVAVKLGETELVKDTDYTVSVSPETTVNAGAYTLTVTGMGNYAGTVTKEFTIGVLEVTPTVTLDVPAEGAAYTGNAITPAVTLKHGDTVIADSEYTVTYADNTNAGTATVTVTDNEKGNYSFAEVKATFAIKEAAPALDITGKKDTVTYGDAAIQLSATGGIADKAVTWTVTRGDQLASISESGLLTIKGAGNVTVTAAQNDDSKAEWSFEVQPAELTVIGVTAADKTYDGKNTVTITAVTLSGIVGSDDVKVATDELTGTLSGAGVGVYDTVKPGNMSLSGAAASNYKLTAPTDPVPASVKIKKANIPAALESIEVKLPVTSTKVEVTGLGAGMPKDAGTLTYINRVQSTVSGNKVIVFKWDVDAQGKLTSEIGAAAGGDQITYEMAVESQNYNNASLKVIVTLGAVAIDSSKLIVTPEKDSLTYNGADQKPAVTVKYDGSTLTAGTDFDVSYPADSKNVGDKEIGITFKGNYSGTATAKYKITKAKVTVSGGSVSDKTFDGTNTATVNAGTLSGVVKGDDVKVTAKGVFNDKNSGSGKKVSVTYTLSGNAAGNYELQSSTATLTGRIYAISANSLYNKVSSLSTANATSAKSQTLKDVVYLANLALSDSGMASSERSSITAVKSDAETMLSRIDSAAAAANTESIRATEKVTKDNVKLSDQAALTKAQSDLNTALTTYSGNYTTGERKEIETDKTRVADALAVVTKADSANKLISALPTDYSNVTAMTADAVQAADDAYSGLNDYAKSLISKEQLEKLNAAKQATEGVAPSQKPADGGMNVTSTNNGEDGGSPETIKFPTGIIVAAVILAGGSAAGYLFYAKKKQDEYDEEEMFF